MIGTRVRQLREKSGMTAVELAEKSGVSQGYISQIENGKRPNPGEDILRKIADALGVSYDVLTLTNKENDDVFIARSKSHPTMRRNKDEHDITIKIDGIVCGIDVKVLPDYSNITDKDERQNLISHLIGFHISFGNALERSITEILFENKDELLSKFRDNIGEIHRRTLERLEYLNNVMESISEKKYDIDINKNNQDGDF
ncbi:helix-turn-helix domain-containing protein [Aneurinibacillus aneurinilyticus]|uniref:Helix-turn-helix transcriptional regulator n=1 Tax=Aneurinibacillus aneurinilyticus TaxID=1391 RepID=A0A848D291_ANEAE|nr:helix-turn-helix transcriptional regulator [Aneurinibacillus aneurinilyticus]NMF00047.1 helix-turn-helix transcriptional regulator [Aneurinibacillus aneurinilyticus]